MNIEDLKKRKELIQNNLKIIRERIAQDTQNSLRLEGAILDINEIIANDEKKSKELEDKEKVEKKGKK